MAAPFLRVGRLSEQRLRMENSFGIFRRTPSLVNFNTKAGTPKKPIRYTSIKKEKPKTIIDIGKLLLQRANDAKVNKQSVIADAAMKAATQTAKPTALKLSSASCESMATLASSPKAPISPSSSDAESVTPIATNGPPLEATSKVTDAIKGLTMSSPYVKDIYEATRSVKQDIYPESEVPEPTATMNIPSEAISSSDLSPLLCTSLEHSSEETLESSTVPSDDLDKVVSTPIATFETGNEAAPIDVTYSEEVHLTDREASAEPSVLSTPGTMTAETVSTHSVSDIKAHATPDIFGPGLSPAGYSSRKATPAPEGEENVCVVEDSTSTSPSSTALFSGVKAADAKMEELEGLTPETLVYNASCSKILSEKGTIAHEIAPEASNTLLELGLTKTEISHTLPFENSAIEDIDSKEMKSSDDDPEQAATSNFKSHAGEMVQITEKILDLTPETVFEASGAQITDPPNGEVAQDDQKTEDEAFKESSDAQMDPIKRLFLDKIREYSTRSRAHDGLVDAGPEYERAFSEEMNKLQRLYGNGDLTSFPEFKFPEPVLDESAPSK